MSKKTFATKLRAILLILLNLEPSNDLKLFKENKQ